MRAYTSAAQKPAAQIVTNTLVADLLGNMNAPIAGNTNWLLNQMQVAALDPTLPIAASISAVGAGPSHQCGVHRQPDRGFGADGRRRSRALGSPRASSRRAA